MVAANNLERQRRIITKCLITGLCVLGIFSCSSSVESGASGEPTVVHKKLITKTKPQEWYVITKAAGRNMYVFSLVPISKDYYNRKSISRFYKISENFNSPKEFLKNLVQSKRYRNPRIVMKNALTWTAGEKHRYTLPITYAEILLDHEVDGTKKIISLVDKKNLNKIRWCLEVPPKKNLGYLNNSRCLNKYKRTIGVTH